MRSIDLLKKIILILLCACMLVASVGCEDEDLTDINTEAKENITNSTELDVESNLVKTLINYLQLLTTSPHFPGSTMENLIDQIKNDRQPLHVKFDPSSYYYVCAYYYEIDEVEKDTYPSAKEYVWVKYENAEDITESYRGIPIIAAFQINRSDFVVNILDDEPVPNMEHFILYEPIFKNGVNVEKNVVIADESYIYLHPSNFFLTNASDKFNVYYSSSVSEHHCVTLPCVYIDGKYYVCTRQLFTKYSDGTYSNDYPNIDIILKQDFGAYYDTLTDMMDVEKYRLVDDDGDVRFFGVFDLEDFVNEVLK